MFTDNKDFYPTPPELIRRMISKVDFYKTKTILEPSAGRGNIVEYIKNYGGNTKHCEIHCIELDNSLQAILKSKNHTLIFDDFLQFESNFKYNVIIMNPPFNQDDGCKHLLKAISIQEQYGGQIVCLLNAESIRNAYSVYRQDLANKLDKYNAEIEFIEDGFANSERHTNVEIALININVPPQRKNSVIIENLKQEEKYKSEQKQANEVVSGDFIDRAIAQYNFEIQAGVKLINEYENILPYISREFDGNSPILKLCMNDSNKYNDSTGGLVNEYIKTIRYKYWTTLFQSKEFAKLFTTDLRSKYMEKLDELRNYDFSKYNIEQIKLDMQLMLSQSLEDTIMALFKDFTYKYSYTKEFDNNIHYYNGWSTNKCSKINDKKIILPLSGFDNYDKSFYPTKWDVREKLVDIEKVFNYLDNGRTQFDSDIYEVLKKAQTEGQTKQIEFKYWLLTFYKKGTTHLEWKDKELVQKFNIYAAINQRNLPPSYGKKSYREMDQTEKNVVDSFEGKESYENVYKDTGFYIGNGNTLLQLGA